MLNMDKSAGMHDGLVYSMQYPYSVTSGIIASQRHCWRFLLFWLLRMQHKAVTERKLPILYPHVMRLKAET